MNKVNVGRIVGVFAVLALVVGVLAVLPVQTNAQESGDFGCCADFGWDSFVGNYDFGSSVGNYGWDSYVGDYGFDSSVGNYGWDSYVGNSGFDSSVGNYGWDSYVGDYGFDSSVGNYGFDSYAGNYGFDSFAGNYNSYTAAEGWVPNSYTAAEGWQPSSYTAAEGWIPASYTAAEGWVPSSYTVAEGYIYDVYDVYDVYGYSTAPVISIPKFASYSTYTPPVSVPVKPVTPQKPVQQVLTPYCTIIATPGTISSGQSVVVSWNSSYATSAHLSTYGSVNTSGSQTFYPTQVTTYTLTVYGQGGSANCQTTVGVTGGPYIPPYNPPNYQTPVCWITLSPATYTFPYNSQATLSWGSSNATSASISGIGSVGTSGSQIVYPSGNQTYTMTVYGNGGSANCYTQSYNPPVNSGLYCTLTANPTYIQNGQSSYLSWTTNGSATSAWLSDGLGNVSTNGSVTVRPESTRTYTLTVSNGYTTNTCQTTVTVSGSYYNYPYINLTQIPYTGFDLGPIGNAMYFLSLMGLAAAAAYLVVYYRGGFVAVALAMAKRPVSATKTFVAPSVAAPAAPKKEEVKDEFSGDTMVLARSRDGSMPKIVINRN